MKIILNCTNLLGDSLYLLRPVQVLLEQSNDVVCIVADKGLAFELFFHSFCTQVPVLDVIQEAEEMYPDATQLNVGAGQAGDISFRLHQERGGQQMHMSEAYAIILGVDLKGVVAPPVHWQQVKEKLPRTFIAISPFSKSCSRHTNERPNKTLDDHKWEFILRYLRRQGMPVKVIAGPNDRLKSNSVPQNDYFTAKNLYELEYFLKSCALLVTLDNGLGHVASVIDTPMISLWPKVSCIDFIYPRFSPFTTCVSMEPNSATPAQLLAGIRHFTKILLGGDNYVETEILREEE